MITFQVWRLTLKWQKNLLKTDLTFRSNFQKALNPVIVWSCQSEMISCPSLNNSMISSIALPIPDKLFAKTYRAKYKLFLKRIWLSCQTYKWKLTNSLMTFFSLKMQVKIEVYLISSFNLSLTKLKAYQKLPLQSFCQPMLSQKPALTLSPTMNWCFCKTLASANLLMNNGLKTDSECNVESLQLSLMKS